MAYIISLRASQQNVKDFKHPLLKGKLVPIDEEQADELVAKERRGEISREELVNSFRICVKTIVARYLYYWPETETLKDDLVSLAFCAVCEVVGSRTDNVLKYVYRQIQKDIADYVNKNRSVAAPSLRNQWYMKKKGKDPIYLESISDSLMEEDAHPEDEGDIWKRDVLEALSKLQPEDEIEEAILDPINWDKKEQELADELGTYQVKVHRRKKKLFQKYLKLIGESK
jgi:hypothetical protein